GGGGGNFPRVWRRRRSIWAKAQHGNNKALIFHRGKRPGKGEPARSRKCGSQHHVNGCKICQDEGLLNPCDSATLLPSKSQWGFRRRITMLPVPIVRPNQRSFANRSARKVYNFAGRIAICPLLLNQTYDWRLAMFC